LILILKKHILVHRQMPLIFRGISPLLSKHSGPRKLNYQNNNVVMGFKSSEFILCLPVLVV
jgi:hypothetical protein